MDSSGITRFIGVRHAKQIIENWRIFGWYKLQIQVEKRVLWVFFEMEAKSKLIEIVKSKFLPYFFLY